jgi:NADPH:quinone reductase-like Zn-dependent oxidoreductase
MRAVQLTAPQTAPVLLETDAPEPIPGATEVLVQVYAAGVTPSELHLAQQGRQRTHGSDSRARIFRRDHSFGSRGQRILDWLDQGKLCVFVDAEVPLSEAAAAYSRKVESRRGYGKTIVVRPALQNQ